MPTVASRLRRLSAPLVGHPLVEQQVRRWRIRTAGRRGATPPADGLVTSTGRGRIEVATLPPATSSALRRLARRGARSGLLVVRPGGVDGVIDAGTVASIEVLAASGVPVWLDPPPGTDLGTLARLTVVLEPPPEPADRPAGDRLRYERSIRTARTASSPEPAVSVLLATRRPDMLDHALAQLGTQRGVELQLVVGLHGDDWPASTEPTIVERWPGAAVVLRPGADLTLGAVLTNLLGRADADLVTKWDDDDWYGPHHVADLVAAHRASAATLVGKAAEFVWLEATDTTVRRPANGARTFSGNIAGGTMLAARSDLLRLGGFPDVPRFVDRHLIAGVRRAGGTVYRTHGFEYVLRRSAAGGHTWWADDAYFAADAVERRPGLDLGFAGIGGPTDRREAP